MLLHPIWAYLLIEVAGLDIKGAALCKGVTDLLNMIIVYALMRYKKVD